MRNTARIIEEGVEVGLLIIVTLIAVVGWAVVLAPFLLIRALTKGSR